MPKMVWFKTGIVPLEQASVSVLDHAYLYGDGLFEGIRFYDRKLFRLDEHLARIIDGSRYLGFELGYSHAEIRQAVLDVTKAADFSDGYVRLNISRGTGLGLDPKNIDRAANLVIIASSLALYPPEAYETGLDVITSSFRMTPADSLDPRLKCSGRYTANILAKQEANRAGAGEALILNHQGYVAECSGDNIFLVRKGHITTPHPSSGLLQGITRDSVFEIARALGLEIREEFLTSYDIVSADEAFLTGTAAEVIPMVSLDGRPIADGKPGPVTAKVMEAFRTLTKDGTAFD